MSRRKTLVLASLLSLGGLFSFLFIAAASWSYLDQQKNRNNVKEIPLKKTETEEVVEFKKQVIGFLDEVQAGVKLLRIHPSVDEAKEESKKISNLYAHLPKTPKEIEHPEVLESSLQAIVKAFPAAEIFINSDDGLEGVIRIISICTNEIQKLLDLPAK